MSDTPKHVLITGPISGIVELADGTKVNVTPGQIEVADQAQADEISFIIGEHHREHGHPDDIDEVEDEDGNVVPVQRPFVHEHDPAFDDHPAKFTGEPAGVPIDDEQKG